MLLDNHLMLLGAAPLHPDLDALDGAVLAARARRERRETQAVTGLAAVAALGAGIMVGLAPASDPNAAAMPFGPPVALTPLIALSQG